MLAMYLMVAPLLVAALGFLYIKKRRARRAAGSAH